MSLGLNPLLDKWQARSGYFAVLSCDNVNSGTPNHQSFQKILQCMRQAKAFITYAVLLLQMTGASAKWTAALDTFDRIKHNFRAPGQVEEVLNSVALDERVLLFKGSDSDIVERLSAYDKMQVCVAWPRADLSVTELGCVQFRLQAYISSVQFITKGMSVPPCAVSCKPSAPAGNLLLQTLATGIISAMLGPTCCHAVDGVYRSSFSSG